MTKHRKANRSWSRFERSAIDRVDALTDEDNAAMLAAQRDGRMEFWRNNLYHVEVNHGDLVPQDLRAWPPMIWLSIRRVERCRLPRDWRDLQRIKNELVGPEREAVELFPAESRLNDEADQFHLWALAEMGTAFPFGYVRRRVSGPDADDGRTSLGGSQRPFEFDGHHEPVPRCDRCARLTEHCVCSQEEADDEG